MSDLRQVIIDAARSMNALGINQGTAGNISARDSDGLLVTPSGVSYEAMQSGDIIAMTMDGDWFAKNEKLRPTSEWRFHRDILQARDDIGAVVHTHAPFATALACARQDIPAFHYMVAVAGGKIIKCGDYATFGSEELSAAALDALGPRNACLLANHGMIACGATVSEALALAVEVEALAAQYVRTLSLGEAVILDDAEMDRVLAKFAAGYGYSSEPGAD